MEKGPWQHPSVARPWQRVSVVRVRSWARQQGRILPPAKGSVSLDLPWHCLGPLGGSSLLAVSSYNHVVLRPQSANVPLIDPPINPLIPSGQHHRFTAAAAFAYDSGSTPYTFPLLLVPTMCEPQSPPLAMSHSPAYHPHYRASQSSSPAFRQQPPPRRPPPAHVEGQPVRSLSDVKASISSATSGSTDATEADRHSRQSQLSSAASHRLSNSNNGHREMVQAPPATVIRYIQYDVDEEEEGEEPGHAIWILVRSTRDAQLQLRPLTMRSFGCHALTLCSVCSAACSPSSLSSPWLLCRPSGYAKQSGHSVSL